MPSSSDQDGPWRRGGGGRFSSSNRNDDRGGGWRGGGGGGGGGDDRGGWRGGSRGDDRGGWRDRGGGGGGGGDDRGGSWRGGGGGSRFGGGGSSERPRLNLKPRGSSSDDNNNKNAPTEKMENLSVDKPAREPEVVNSRAAGLGSTGFDSRREREPRGPPPVRNKRFEQMAEEERERREREGPPPVANSRFAAAAQADRSSRDRDEPMQRRGPPPVANSRFAAAAEADRSNRDSYEPSQRRGPPPMANSRFAAAARMAEEENMEEQRGREDSRGDRRGFNNNMDGDRRGGYNNNMDGDRRGGYNNSNRGPPLPTSSRFAAAAAADSDYVDRDERDRRYSERQNERMMQREQRFNGPPPNSSRSNEPGPPTADDYMKQMAREKSKVSNLLKAKAPAAEDNILKFPVKAPSTEQESNMLQMPSKKKEPEPVVAPAHSPEPKPEPAAPAVVHSEESLKEFVTTDKRGDDLKEWCTAQGAALPPVHRLLMELLMAKEKLNPDVDCAWAEPDQYGAAFLSLVEDDLFGQMQVLWAIQQYCDSIGFPKLNDEYVVQAMFRSMYKYDLATDDAFASWKEDESDEYEKGKMTAIIQTVDWFNWLEEEDDEDEEYYEEE